MISNESNLYGSKDPKNLYEELLVSLMPFTRGIDRLAIASGQWSLFYEESLSSQISEVCRLADKIVNKLRENYWDEDISDQIFVALDEALVNAVQHGNHQLPWKKVFVRCRISADLVQIEITDEGEGFDPEKVADPTTADQIHKKSGRGIHLMRHFMDKVEYSFQGTRVYMERRMPESLKKRSHFSDNSVFQND